MGGWIKVHREIFDSDIWHDVTTFRLFLILIGKASHQDGLKYKGMTLNKGQYVRSYRKLSEDLTYKEGRGYKKYSLSTIRSCVKKLVDDGRVTIEEVELGTLFTIINYEIYQNDQSHFNALNTLETPNVNRTEERTLNRAQETNVINGFDVSEKETPNELNDELRTNAELMPNVNRTNSEQDQELKNLRIKELYKDDDNNARVNPFEFYEQEGFGTISSFTAERLGDLIDTYSELSVLAAMKESVLHGARNLKYVEAILRNSNSDRGGNRGKSIQQHRGGHEQTPRKDSITGGQVGWIKSRRA